MPQYNRRELDAKSREYGFNRDTFEKVLRLRTILEFLNTQEYMRKHLLLKGGTAINLTVFKLPRLSVDIDLDFVPNLTRAETMDERERLTDILKGYMSEQSYTLSGASRFSHSLDAFHYNYVNAAGNKDMIKIEINYSLRTHVLPSEDRVFVTDAFGEAIKVRTVAAMEIFAAKTNALISRAAAFYKKDSEIMIRNQFARLGCFSNTADYCARLYTISLSYQNPVLLTLNRT